ncbi:ABC transporter ATP-binding protein [Hutsoniella sourekii]
MSNLLEATNLSKSYLNRQNKTVTQALDQVNFSVKDKEFVSLVGPSGCGKTTLLRLVSGLITPTQGSLTLNGEEIKQPSIDRGLVFQKPTLFPWLTIYENVKFGLKNKPDLDQSDQRVHDLIQMVGLQDFAQAYPHQLSGGMAQRVALIRTMITQPKVFLLDEPLGALDAFTRMEMQDEILKMAEAESMISLMVTHDVDEAIYMSSRVLIMAPRPGRIVEDLTIDLPKDRNRTSRAFLDYRSYILNRLNFGESEDLYVI